MIRLDFGLLGFLSNVATDNGRLLVTSFHVKASLQVSSTVLEIVCLLRAVLYAGTRDQTAVGDLSSSPQPSASCQQLM